LENSSNVADLFGGYLARGDIKPLLTYEENIEKLKPEMIQTVAKRYLEKEKATQIKHVEFPNTMITINLKINENVYENIICFLNSWMKATIGISLKYLKSK